MNRSKTKVRRGDRYANFDITAPNLAGSAATAMTKLWAMPEAVIAVEEAKPEKIFLDGISYSFHFVNNQSQFSLQLKDMTPLLLDPKFDRKIKESIAKDFNSVRHLPYIRHNEDGDHLYKITLPAQSGFFLSSEELLVSMGFREEVEEADVVLSGKKGQTDTRMYGFANRTNFVKEVLADDAIGSTEPFQNVLGKSVPLPGTVHGVYQLYDTIDANVLQVMRGKRTQKTEDGLEEDVEEDDDDDRKMPISVEAKMDDVVPALVAYLDEIAVQLNLKQFPLQLTKSYDPLTPKKVLLSNQPIAMPSLFTLKLPAELLRSFDLPQDTGLTFYMTSTNSYSLTLRGAASTVDFFAPYYPYSMLIRNLGLPKSFVDSVGRTNYFGLLQAPGHKIISDGFLLNGASCQIQVSFHDQRMEQISFENDLEIHLLLSFKPCPLAAGQNEETVAMTALSANVLRHLS